MNRDDLKKMIQEELEEVSSKEKVYGDKVQKDHMKNVLAKAAVSRIISKAMDAAFKIKDKKLQDKILKHMHEILELSKV